MIGPEIWRSKPPPRPAPGEPGGPPTTFQIIGGLLSLLLVHLLFERPPLTGGAWRTSLRQVLVFGIMASIWFAAVKLVFSIRSSPPLSVHQDGFRYKGEVFPFAEVGEIRIRRVAAVPSDQTSGDEHGPIEMRTRWDAEFLSSRTSRPARAQVTIVTARGNAMDLGDLLSRVAPDDLDDFVRRVEASRPGLVRKWT